MTDVSREEFEQLRVDAIANATALIALVRYMRQHGTFATPEARAIFEAIAYSIADGGASHGDSTVQVGAARVRQELGDRFRLMWGEPPEA
jgi:hypothetical protein